MTLANLYTEISNSIMASNMNAAQIAAQTTSYPNSCFAPMSGINPYAGGFIPMTMPTMPIMPVMPMIPFNFNLGGNQLKAEGTSSAERKQGASTATGSRIVDVVLGEKAKGVHETSNNDSTDIAKYKGGAHNNLPWCAFFASWCTQQATGKKLPAKNRASCISIIESARRDGYYERMNSGYTPKLGDYAIYSNGKHGHVATVTKVYADGSFETTGGNESGGIKTSKRTYQNNTKFTGFVRTEEWVNAKGTMA